MVSVNLLPPHVATARRRRQRTRLWAFIAATVTAVTALPLALDLTNSARASSVEARISPLEAKRDRVLGALKETSAQCTALSTQIARADALRAKRDWAGLLTLIGERAPDSVWLTALKTRARPPGRSVATRAGQAAGDGAEKPVMLAGPTGIHLEGYALSHESLYEFMSALKAANVFATVELASAGKEPVLNGFAVRFAIECDW